MNINSKIIYDWTRHGRKTCWYFIIILLFTSTRVMLTRFPSSFTSTALPATKAAYIPNTRGCAEIREIIEFISWLRTTPGYGCGYNTFESGTPTRIHILMQICKISINRLCAFEPMGACYADNDTTDDLYGYDFFGGLWITNYFNLKFNRTITLCKTKLIFSQHVFDKSIIDLSISYLLYT